MAQSKPFVIATEGPTIDGRTITREWITQMAASYDPKVYTAVANLEHYISSLPDSVFAAYGKVVSLSTREATLMGEKKLQLLAVVDANDELVAMQNKGKKAFSSMEVLANFCGKGIAYLTGLAFTDTPASIGTESMKFSLAGSNGDRFACAEEIALEFEIADQPNAGESLFAKVKNLLGLNKKDADARFADQAAAIEAIAQSQKDLLDKFTSIEPITGELIEGKTIASAEDVKALQEAQKKFDADFAALQEKLSSTDADPSKRKPATGGEGRIKPDC